MSAHLRCLAVGVLVCLSALPACSRRPAPKAELPSLSLDAFPPKTRQQIGQFYTKAKAQPDNAGAVGRLGMMLHAYHANEVAEACYTRALSLDPQSFEWAYLLGVIQQTGGKVDAALENFRLASRLKPDYKQAQARIAECLLVKHSYAESQKIYAGLVAGDADLAIYRYGLGRVFVAQKDLKSAVEQLEKACQIYPRYGPAHYALAMAYRDMGDRDRARSQLDLYKRDPNRQPVSDPLLEQVSSLNTGSLQQEQLAQQLHAAGRTREAADVLEKVVAEDPDEQAAHANLIAYYWELQDWTKAEQHYREVAKHNPSSTVQDSYGLVLLDQGKYAEAATLFKIALDANPLDPTANTQMCRILAQTGNIAGAAQYCQKALQADPSSRAANYVFALAMIKNGRTQDAIPYLLRTLQPQDEKTPAYMRELAAAYRKIGNQERAQFFEQEAANLIRNLAGRRPQLASDGARELPSPGSASAHQ